MDFKARASGVCEQNVHALPFQRLDQNVRAHPWGVAISVDPLGERRSRWVREVVRLRTFVSLVLNTDSAMCILRIYLERTRKQHSYMCSGMASVSLPMHTALGVENGRSTRAAEHFAWGL